MDYGLVYIFIAYNSKTSSDVIYNSDLTLIWFIFKLYLTNFISYQISAWGIVSLVLKSMMSSDFLYGRGLSKTEMNLEKFGVVNGRWFMGWFMEGVQGVVHGRGPRGSPWSVFNSPPQSPVLMSTGQKFPQPEPPP